MTGQAGQPGDMRLIITGPDGKMDITDEVKPGAGYKGPIYTFGFVKPHAYPRRDEIMDDIWRLSEARHSPLYVLVQKDDYMTHEVAEKHYAAHREKPFFRSLIDMVTGPTHLFLLAGRDAVPSFRNLLGATDPRQAEKGTLRYKYGEPERGIAYNAIHGSDSLNSMVEETLLHFDRGEVDEFVWARIDAYKKWLDHLKETGTTE